MIHITSEPVGETYAALLKFAMTRCDTFSLVWRHQLNANTGADAKRAELENFLISKSDVRKWPGTELANSKATIRHYRLSAQSLDCLLHTSGLYAWLNPDLPEDLALYRGDGSYWLASVAHEQMAWISDATLTVQELARAVPELQVKLAR